MNHSNRRSSKALYRPTEVEGYKETAHIFAPEYYHPGAEGEDDFSRRESWFYYMGDEEIGDDFEDKMEKIVHDLFTRNAVDWDIITLAPSSGEDTLNPNMLKLCHQLSEESGIEYRQVLKRSKEVVNKGELESSRARFLNLEGSIEILGDVKGLNIIIINNVSIYGFGLAQMTSLLLEAGAERVFCLCLGLTNGVRRVQSLDKGETASSAVEDWEVDDG